MTSRTKTTANPRGATAGGFESLRPRGDRGCGRRRGAPGNSLARLAEPEAPPALRERGAPEEPPSVRRPPPHEPAFAARVARPVVLLEERGVAEPAREGALVGAQLDEDRAQGVAGLADDVGKDRPALRDRRHPVLQMARHRRRRDLGAVE